MKMQQKKKTHLDACTTGLTCAGLEQHLHTVSMLMGRCSSQNMQTGCRDTTTGYCQFGGGSGTGWGHCQQSQMKSTEMRGFFKE